MPGIVVALLSYTTLRDTTGLALGQLHYSILLRPSSTELRFHLL